ncbi:MAG: GDP-fucose synthetase [Methylobacter sp.]|nr:MAG: GDP-fucose synthetase [Methylobacter sp.]
MEKIMVTGGKGLLGYGMQRVTELEPREGYQFVFVDIDDADLCDKEQTRALFDKVRPSGVIHLAADVGELYKNLAHGVEMFENNLLMNMHVMQCCKDFDVKKLASCLSTCTFPEPTLSAHIQLPIDETMLHMGPPHPSNEGYAYAKRMVDVQSRYYRKQFGCNFISLAPTNIFGPNDNYSPEHSHVIPAMIRKCQTAMAEDKDFVVWGTGKPLRQFIFSFDLARLFIWAYFNYDEAEPLILAPDSSQEVSIGTIAQYVADAFGYEKPLVFDTSYSDGQFKRTVTNKKLLSLNPSFQFTPLPVAIKESVDWFKNNMAIARL